MAPGSRVDSEQASAPAHAAAPWQRWHPVEIIVGRLFTVIHVREVKLFSIA
jgi:hypothetical protein